MARKSRKEQVQGILQALEKGPMTANEISLEVGSNWDTVRNTLDFLKSMGLVLEHAEGKKRIYARSQGAPVQEREDTLMGLPLSNKSEQLCYYLFEKIKKKWVEKTGREPGKTQMQKTLVEVADSIKTNVQIPRGWYLFGQVCVLKYDPDKKYKSKFKDKISGINREVSRAVEIYSRFDSKYQIQTEHYRRKKNNLYLAKLDLEKALLSRHDPDTHLLISKMLRLLVIYFPETDDSKEALGLLQDYMSILSRLFLEKSRKELEQMHPLVVDCFMVLWELMGACNLFNDLLEGSYGYGPRTLKRHFAPRKKVLVSLCRDHLEELNGHLAPIEIDRNSKLGKLMGSAKPAVLTKKERDKMFEKYEEKDLSEVFRVFDLD